MSNDQGLIKSTLGPLFMAWNAVQAFKIIVFDWEF